MNSYARDAEAAGKAVVEIIKRRKPKTWRHLGNAEGDYIKWLARWAFHWAALASLLLCASAASAQTPVTGTSGATFTASADQNTVAADGVTPILTRYEIRFTAAVPASCASQPVVNLGKPTPGAGNVISVVPVAALGTLPANCVYTAVVAAIGPGGEGVTPASAPFVRVVPKVPAAAGTPTIVP